MSTRIQPMVTISNNTGAIMDYLTGRTDETIGKLVERADGIVVGQVEKYESSIVPVKPEDISALKPWLSRDVGGQPAMFIQITTIQVETCLSGPFDAGKLEIAFVYPAMAVPGGGEVIPIFHAGERGLLFLKKIPPDIPYSCYIPESGYTVAEGETGIRSFLVNDYDEKGNPFIKDETARIQETIEAVKWYYSLSKERPEKIRKALFQSVDNPNPRISRHAVRTLARCKEPGSAELFKVKLTEVNPDTRVRLMLGLWIFGEKDSAADMLDEFFRAEGKLNWLAGWNIQPTTTEQDQPVETLYGPDPAEVKGD
ncbi:MAG: HEAT repeat domain-containing protein [Dehalococcoidales bacterium]|nr:HEAT repeat domain-containing protein [Dehalococcoidales bacterium]